VEDPLRVELGPAGSHVDLGLCIGREKGATAPVTSVLTPGGLRGTITGNGELIRTDVTQLQAGDFRWNNQRTMWWNGHVERWDTILPTASPPASGESHWWLWTDLMGDARPAQALTTRPSSPDAFWDDAACELSVFFSRDSSGTSRFHSHTYDPYADRYVPRLGEGGVPSEMRGSRRVTIVSRRTVTCGPE
jgi:hypothetical protein